MKSETEIKEKISFFLDIAEIGIGKNTIRIKMWTGKKMPKSLLDEKMQLCAASYFTYGTPNDVVICLRKLANCIEGKMGLMQAGLSR